MMKDNKTTIQPGDLVTLCGMNGVEEKPIGMVKKVFYNNKIEIFWLNENIAQRYALNKWIYHGKLEVISKASQQSS
tara:strand:+ start:8253 stop:8480 length:228 start_codon:yes stop_codon:yes gene_type:complete